MMSNSTADLIYELYSDFYVNKISVSRGINSTRSVREKVDELIITSYEPAKGVYLSNINGDKS